MATTPFLTPEEDARQRNMRMMIAQNNQVRRLDDGYVYPEGSVPTGPNNAPPADYRTMENLQKKLSDAKKREYEAQQEGIRLEQDYARTNMGNEMIGQSSMQDLAQGLMPLVDKISKKRFADEMPQTQALKPTYNAMENASGTSSVPFNAQYTGASTGQMGSGGPASAGYNPYFGVQQDPTGQTSTTNADRTIFNGAGAGSQLVPREVDPTQQQGFDGQLPMPSMPQMQNNVEAIESNVTTDQVGSLADVGRSPSVDLRDPVKAKEVTDKLYERESQEPGFIRKMMADPNFFPQMAIAFNTLRLRPDAGLNTAMMSQIETNNATKAANRTAQWFVSQGREDLAAAVTNGLPMKEAFAQFSKKPDETFRALNTEEYELLGHNPLKDGRLQVSNTTGKFSTIGSRPAQTNIEIDTGGGGKYQEELGKGFAKSDIELYDSAQKAPQRISQLNATAQAITTGAASLGEEGFQTGPLAAFRQGVDSFLVAFGDRSPERINRLTDAELIDATLGADVFGAIGELGIGARGLDTPAEREFLRQVLTGTIKTTPAALLYLAHLRQKIQMGVVDKYNQRIENNVYGQLGEDRNMTKIEYADSIFGQGFTNFDDAKRWLETKKKEYANEQIDKSVGPSGSGSFTDEDGTEYDIERVN